MIFRSEMFKRVTIVGVGLMGGSLGLAIKKHSLARHIVGFSQKETSIAEALKNKAIDEGSTDVTKAVRNSDLVVLAAPVQAIIKLMPVINPHLWRHCIVTDMGGTKVDILEAAEKNLSSPSFFVGSHPLAGSEKQGVQNARGDLFENTQCLMTPTAKTNPFAKEKVKQLWTKLGAKVKFVSAEEHDEILNFISHLPHLMAFGLMGTVPDKCVEYAAQGLKDTTRIASSSPQLWSDICLSNPKNIIRALDDFSKQLSFFRKAILDRDEKGLMAYFAKAKERREKF